MFAVGVSNLRSREQGLHQRAAKQGLALRCEVSNVSLPMLDNENNVVWRDWPMILPHNFELRLQL